MEKYKITGMSCAACAARVEKAVNGLDGVENCQVNLLTNSMTVSGSAKPQEIIVAVEKAGYKAAIDTAKPEAHTKQRSNTPIIKRLIISSALLLALMYISMGHGMFGLPLPSFLHYNPVANALTQAILSALIMLINRNFFINGFKGIINRSPNMDTLIALGSSASYIYSIANLFVILKLFNSGNTIAAGHILHDLYFEAAAMILIIITIGKLLEERSKGKTTSAIEALIRMSPKTATVIIDGKEIIKDITKVAKGDIFVVRPGESIPVDAVIIEGFTSINESALTGESIPIEKTVDDKVFAASINLTGFIKCRALKVGEDTSFAKIIKLVSDASASKAPIGKIADKVSGIFVPIVLIISLITLIAWLFCDATIGYALSRAVSVLVISCPCALGLATPVAIMVGNGIGAKHGILFKSAEILENTAKATVVCLDKTGTITSGHPEVTDVYPINCTKTELLQFAASLEKQSEHPLAIAIMKKSAEEGISPFIVSDFSAEVGGGVKAKWEDKLIFGGNYRFVSGLTNITDDIKFTAEKMQNDGKTPMFFATETNLLGIIAVADEIRKDAKETIAELKNMGIKTVMLTGDNDRAAKRIAVLSGVDEVFSELLPEDKNKKISELKKNAKIIMVGDGINDAPAISSADIGIALSSGSDIAIDAGDIVLTKNNLSLIPAAIRLSHKTLSTIHVNLFWAFIYNILCIPLAAGVFVNSLGLTVSPMIAALAMCLSDICVVSNALRLNFVKIFNSKEKTLVKKLIKIEGMMCPHCENRVKSLLEGLTGVTEVSVSHKENKAEIVLSKDISNDILIKLITDAGYTVTDIK